MDFSGFLTVGAAVIAGSFWGFLGGAAAGAFVGWRNGMRVDALEARMERAHLASISQSGVDSREQKSERMSAAMARALILLKEGKAPVDVAKEVGVEYPDVAADVLKKVIKGQGLGGIGKTLGF
jgi:hypothetical protein